MKKEGTDPNMPIYDIENYVKNKKMKKIFIT